MSDPIASNASPVRLHPLPQPSPPTSPAVSNPAHSGPQSNPTPITVQAAAERSRLPSLTAAFKRAGEGLASLADKALDKWKGLSPAERGLVIFAAGLLAGGITAAVLANPVVLGIGALAGGVVGALYAVAKVHQQNQQQFFGLVR